MHTQLTHKQPHTTFHMVNEKMQNFSSLSLLRTYLEVHFHITTFRGLLQMHYCWVSLTLTNSASVSCLKVIILRVFLIKASCLYFLRKQMYGYLLCRPRKQMIIRYMCSWNMHQSEHWSSRLQVNSSWHSIAV
jgi:hypothetical protein